MSKSLKIDPDRLKAQIIRKGYTLKEVAVELHYSDQWIYQCMYRGKMSVEGVEAMERFGINRRWFVIR